MQARPAVEVAALFVYKDGCYAGLGSVDLWCEDRDARKYSDSYPVVAHPPCQLWGKFAPINYKRWGGEHNKPGNDNGCFESALASLFRCGGVLEHPAFSKAWNAYGLLKPEPNGGWIYDAKMDCYVCEIYQASYGHKAAKRTWLIYKGNKIPFDLKWGKKVGDYQIGFHDQRGKSKNKPTLSGRAASATPPEFRDELIRLAMWSRGLS